MPIVDVCVGSLLVPSSDVQELTQVKLKKRATVPVGTLLVPPQDLSSSSDRDGELPATSLQRRITNKLTGPAPPDSEAESWAD